MTFDIQFAGSVHSRIYGNVIVVLLGQIDYPC